MNTNIKQRLSRPWGRKYAPGGFLDFGMDKDDKAAFAGVAGTAGSIGSGIIDAAAHRNDLGNMSTGAMMGSSALKGAAMGASLGPAGAAVGSVLGAGMGLLQGSQLRRQERGIRRAQQRTALYNAGTYSAGLIGANPELVQGVRGASMFAGGGDLKDGKRPPIITNDPKDPKLRAYNDSLSLYNTMRFNSMSEKTGADPLDRKGFIPYDKLRPLDPSLENFEIGDTDVLTTDKLRIGRNGKTTVSKPVNIIRSQSDHDALMSTEITDKDQFSRKVNPAIKPIGFNQYSTTFNDGRVYNQYSLAYKKPVQPVVYEPHKSVPQQPIARLARPGLPEIPNPTQSPQQMDFYQMKGHEPVYGPGKALIGKIDGQDFYPDYGNTAARTPGADADLLGNEAGLQDYLRAKGFNGKVQKKAAGGDLKDYFKREKPATDAPLQKPMILPDRSAAATEAANFRASGEMAARQSAGTTVGLHRPDDRTKQYVDEQHRQRDYDYMGLNADGSKKPGTALQDNPHFRKGAENLVLPVINTTLALDGVAPVAEAAGKAVAGAVAKGVNNAYRVNPWAFKANPDAFYRQINPTTYGEYLESGLVRGQQDLPAGGQGISLVKAFGDDAYFKKSGLYYKPGTPAYDGISHLVEANMPEEAFKPKLNGRAKKTFEQSGNVAVPREVLSLDNPNVNMYRKDWLRGWKPVQQQKQFAGGGDLQEMFKRERPATESTGIRRPVLRTPLPVKPAPVTTPVSVPERVQRQVTAAGRQEHNFAVVDKNRDSAYYFRPDGSNITGEPVITGRSGNDTDYGMSMKDWFKKTGSSDHEEYFNYLEKNHFQTTPAGAFKVSDVRHNTADNPDMVGDAFNKLFRPQRAEQIKQSRLRDYGAQQQMLTLESEAGVPSSKAIHGTLNPVRVDAFAHTADKDAPSRKLSNGCINVNGKSVAFNVLEKGSGVYILPEEQEDGIVHPAKKVAGAREFADQKKKVAQTLTERGLPFDQDAVNFITAVGAKETHNGNSWSGKLEEMLPLFSKTTGTYQINPKSFHQYLPAGYDQTNMEDQVHAVYNFYQQHKQEAPDKAYNAYSGDRKGKYNTNFNAIHQRVSNTYATGGALPTADDAPLTRALLQGGTAKPLSSDSVDLQGPSHAEGGIGMPQLGAEVEGGETAKGSFVFSKELGFAKLHRPIAKNIGVIEKKPQTEDRKKALSLLRAREERLAQQQEQLKQLHGIQ